MNLALHHKITLSLVILALLSGCGNRRFPVPQAGKSLPVAPYGAEEKPDSQKLLTVQPQKRPERNVELLRRSEVRKDDPFDLPPEDE